MTAAILSIGTELTRGEIANENARWLADSLSALGLAVVEIATVDDDQERVVHTVLRLAQHHDLVVATGGLGPTTDDLTREAVAQALGVPLVDDATSLDHIRARFARAGRTMAASNAKQAQFPSGATILPNSEGTAPGFSCQLGSARLYFLPGVPKEMRHLFLENIEPVLLQTRAEQTAQIRLNTFGLSESEINDHLDGIASAYGVILGYRAHFPEIVVKVIATGPGAGEARAVAERAAQAVTERLTEHYVYSRGETTLATSVGELLATRGQRLAVAESCTGGLVAEALTRSAGASAYFAGGVVSYSNESKQRLLGVPQALIASDGAVSESVARAMAKGAQRQFECDASVAITGIAGPSGGSVDKPVGLVYYAASLGSELSVQNQVFRGDRRRIQLAAGYASLMLLRKLLMQRPG